MINLNAGANAICNGLYEILSRHDTPHSFIEEIKRISENENDLLYTLHWALFTATDENDFGPFRPDSWKNGNPWDGKTFDNFDIAKYLIDVEKVNPATGDNQILKYACSIGNIAALTLLLKDKRVQPVDVKSIDWYILDPMMSSACAQAAKHGRTAVLQMLYRDHRITAEDWKKLLMITLRNGQIHAFEDILRTGKVNPLEVNQSIVKEAYEYKQFDILKRFLALDTLDANSQNINLQWACQNGLTTIVNIILNSAKADPTANECRALSLAMTNGHLDIAKKLIHHPSVLHAMQDVVNQNTLMNMFINPCRINNNLDMLALICRTPRLRSELRRVDENIVNYLSQQSRGDALIVLHDLRRLCRAMHIPAQLVNTIIADYNPVTKAVIENSYDNNELSFELNKFKTRMQKR